MALSTIPFSALSSDASKQGVNFRNLIINGDMSIAQRGTSTSGVGSGGYYACDRWNFSINSMGNWTLSQDTDVPTGQGFAKSFKLDCTSAAASPAASAEMSLRHKFEGQMLQVLKKGTSNAESMTISFWVKSNKTGTFIVRPIDQDNARHISKSYTINSADTWEKKTITFEGDTTGAYNNDNGRSLDVCFYLGAGSNFTSGTLATSWETSTSANACVGISNLADSTSNYMNITGVQLEVGTSASDFEFLPYDVNLRRCQRYYYKYVLGFLGGYSRRAGTSISFSALEAGTHPAPMRSSPTITAGTPTYISCSGLSFTSNTHALVARVTSSSSAYYRAYETDVEVNAEL